MSSPSDNNQSPSSGMRGAFSRAYYAPEIKIPNKLFDHPSTSLVSSKGGAINVDPPPPSKEHFTYNFPHARINNDFYTVTAGTDEWFPPIPSRDNVPAPNLISVCELRRLRWITNKHPYLMLVPLDPFQGLLFECLGFTQRNAPVQQSSQDGSFFLAADLMMQILSLEKNMVAIYSAMNRLKRWSTTDESNQPHEL